MAYGLHRREARGSTPPLPSASIDIHPVGTEEHSKTGESSSSPTKSHSMSSHPKPGSCKFYGGSGKNASINCVLNSLKGELSALPDSSVMPSFFPGADPSADAWLAVRTSREKGDEDGSGGGLLRRDRSNGASPTLLDVMTCKEDAIELDLALLGHDEPSPSSTLSFLSPSSSALPPAFPPSLEGMPGQHSSSLLPSAHREAQPSFSLLQGDSPSSLPSSSSPPASMSSLRITGQSPGSATAVPPTLPPPMPEWMLLPVPSLGRKPPPRPPSPRLPSPDKPTPRSPDPGPNPPPKARTDLPLLNHRNPSSTHSSRARGQTGLRLHAHACQQGPLPPFDTSSPSQMAESTSLTAKQRAKKGRGRGAYGEGGGGQGKARLERGEQARGAPSSSTAFNPSASTPPLSLRGP